MKDINDSMNKSPIYEAVKCPRCGSTHIEFITEYHKHIWLRLLVLILGAVCIIFAIRYSISFIRFENGNFDDLRVVIIVGVFYIIFQLAIWIGESKTHVQGICRDCGNIWLLN